MKFELEKSQVDCEKKVKRKVTEGKRNATGAEGTEPKKTKQEVIVSKWIGIDKFVKEAAKFNLKILRYSQNITPKEIPEVCQKFVAGIDEAGRGPVIGPLVQSIFFSDPEKDKELKNMGVMDSKMLTFTKREEIFEKFIEKDYKWDLACISPEFISNEMTRKGGMNLNQIEHKNIFSFVDDYSNCIEHLYIDSIGGKKNAEKMIGPKIVEKVGYTIEIKADDKYISVSAASIVAKVMRDRILREMERIYNSKQEKKVAFGSGYPSDPNSKTLLKMLACPVIGYPYFVRTSWSTAKTILDAKKNVKKTDD